MCCNVLYARRHDSSGDSGPLVNTWDCSSIESVNVLIFHICNCTPCPRVDIDAGPTHGSVLCQRPSDRFGWAIAPADAHRGVDRPVIADDGASRPTLAVEDLLVGDCH